MHMELLINVYFFFLLFLAFVTQKCEYLAILGEAKSGPSNQKTININVIYFGGSHPSK